MAFTGTPAIKIVGDNLVRISPAVGQPFFLAAGDSGTIGLFESLLAPDIVLPAAFRPRMYSGADTQFVSLQDSVQVIGILGGPTVNMIAIAKTGTIPTDFSIFISAPNPTQDLEIYIRFH